ncbi:ABC efflux pump, inner membrane subunit [Candidatus Koribacter versatilis Ellin345]|uniref:ABC efflux pump, inner membrane subunit n=2 Tax=Candidatus Korobacter versatilis TaxID=658062 RepID=Q1IQ02_KORVE|nr:ABC efflux pump, inner membrane subunit [Candidatus Koribacter versatilis Ellin345]
MLRAIWEGVRNVVRPRAAQRDAQQEIDAFYEAAIADKKARGMTENEARRQVRLENGSADLVRDAVFESRWEDRVESVRRDVAFAGRILARNFGLSVIAVVTLALAIGSTTAVYSVVEGVLLRPFPFTQQDRLLMVWQKGEDGKNSNVGFATFDDWRKLNHSFSYMGAVSFWTPTLVSDAGAENLSGFRVSAGMFDMLGVRMRVGRDFTKEEDIRGQGTSVILGYALWQSRFGGDPAVVGKSVQLGSKVYTVVGVLPENMPSVFSFDPRKEADIYSPLAYDTSLEYACRTCQHLRVLGRLRDGVTEKQALAEMDQISKSLVQQYPTEYAASGVLFTELHEYVVGNVRPVLLLLFGAVALVLLIACVNVSNLLLSLALKRRREFALRASLGAGSRRLVRQMLTEALSLACVGSALGFGLAWAILRAVLKAGGTSLPRMHDVHLDAGVLAFTIFVCVASALIFGLLPAFHARKADPVDALNEGTRATTSGGRLRLKNALVASNVAISLVLLIAAGLMTKSFVRLTRVNPGLSSKGVLTVRVSLWGQKYQKDPAVVSFYDEVLRRISAVPGVESVGLTSQLPLGGNLDRYGVHAVDKPRANPENDPSADRYSISPEYFRALLIPLLQGREFTNEDDRTESQKVMVISETFAKTVWPGEDPIGKQLRVGGMDSPIRTVVGVVGDVLHKGLDAEHTMQMYIPHSQFTDSDVVLVVRAKGVEPAAIGGDVRRAITAVDAQQPIGAEMTMAEVVRASVARQRFSALLFAAFALCGALMAAVGIYGVVSYAVVQRTQEIGIRIAMGAPAGSVFALILKKGMQPALLGLMAGLPAAFAISQLLASLLFKVKANDAVTYAAMTIAVIAVALLACIVPARRATHVNAVTAIRTE